jgi:hypothetical protein
MRSFWIDRLFRHVHSGGQALTQPQMGLSEFSPRARTASKGRGIQAGAVRTSKSARLCLGIGDGSVHRQ